jgi:hypothetical protein
LGVINFYGQNDIVKDFTIYTSDVENFWDAFSKLPTADNYQDSIKLIEEIYLNNKSQGLEEFLKVRPRFTAKAYIESINKFPLFWTSIRKRTENLSGEEDLIKKSFIKIKKIYPDFKAPNVCFAISPIKTGGTASHDGKMILIGTELAAIDSTVNLSEFPEQVKKILGTIYIPHLVIHESIHSAQNILTDIDGIYRETMLEGSAEFVTTYLLNQDYRKASNEYGYKNEQELWAEFKTDMENNTNFNKWFGGYYQNKHPDLGYFFGYRIVEAYFKKAKDKEKALIDIIKLNDPDKIFIESGYNGNIN